jgi:TetR/AcrR family acrAB operon transcriptional repressor
MRRTKAEAAKTRRRIMAAALRVFGRRGIARTTIEDVAQVAGVTRGAVYWHFAGKQALLRAIRDSVSLPLLDQSDLALLRDGGGEPLEGIERFLLAFVRSIDTDAPTRHALEVMSFKCEYVGDLAPERGAMVRNTHRLLRGFENAYARARERGELRADLPPRVAAMETIAFLSGLVRLLLLDPADTAMAARAPDVIRAHVRSRRAISARGRFACPERAAEAERARSR